MLLLYKFWNTFKNYDCWFSQQISDNYCVSDIVLSAADKNIEQNWVLPLNYIIS